MRPVPRKVTALPREPHRGPGRGRGVSAATTASRRRARADLTARGGASPSPAFGAGPAGTHACWAASRSRLVAGDAGSCQRPARGVCPPPLPAPRGREAPALCAQVSSPARPGPGVAAELCGRARPRQHELRGRARGWGGRPRHAPPRPTPTSTPLSLSEGLVSGGGAGPGAEGWLPAGTVRTRPSGHPWPRVGSRAGKPHQTDTEPLPRLSHTLLEQIRALRLPRPMRRADSVAQGTLRRGDTRQHRTQTGAGRHGAMGTCWSRQGWGNSPYGDGARGAARPRLFNTGAFA